MTSFEKEDQDCINIQRQHGPGGELPALCAVKTTKKEPKKEKNQPQNTKWEPLKPERNEMEKLRDCATHILPVGALSAVVFYWQQSGQLAETTGFYALIVLALIGGLTIGKYAMR